jgi:undecaprenyl-diphosphatase
VPAETRALLAIHAQAGPWFDRFFVLSHYLGTLWFCVPLVLVLVLWHRAQGERTVANVWLVVGLSTYLVQEGMKRLIARPRPALWPRLETWPPVAGSESFAFPSGHALAAATFYPLLAYVLTRGRPQNVRRGALLAGTLVALWIGLGRLYLGVHWPTDVLAGWALGAAQAALAMRRLAVGPEAPSQGGA